jgi:3-hydroxy acid dehydrogenase / malonic semialdehyde reductase
MFGNGTTALVTGGSGGIGSEIVKVLAAAGVHTIAASNDAERLAALEGIDNVEVCFVDVTDAERLTELFGDRQIDFLINAAGVLGVTGTLYSVPGASAQRIFDVNVIGVHNALSAIVPGMVARNRGHIINIGSIAGPYPSVGQPMYSASKAAVHNMSMNLRMELFGTDIKVTELRPGRVRSGMHAEMFEGDQAKAAELLYDPYECMEGRDIANVIKFVLDTPPQVCIAQIEVIPTHQVVGGTKMFQRDQNAKS